ncbi:hypothetical protein [Streptomyces noursei]
MAFLGFLEYGGVEILNEARTAAYSARAGLGLACTPCDGLNIALGSPDYTTPKADRAPWYDPHYPESGRVLGMLGMDIVGTNDATGTRSPTESVGDGSVIGPLRMAHREIQVSLGVLALDECALVYAMGWLAHVLKGVSCTRDECSGLTLCMYACCPGDDDGDVPGQDSKYLRHFMAVGLMDGPQQISLTGGLAGGSGGASTLTSGGSRQGVSGGSLITAVGAGGAGDCTEFGRSSGTGAVATGAEFTLVAGKPWAYASGIEVVEWVKLVKGGKVAGFDPDKQREACAEKQREEGPRCDANPHCPFPSNIPTVPMPVDKCYPTKPYDAWRMVKTVSPLRMPRQAEGVPWIRFDTGTKPLENTMVRFYQNLQGRDCAKYPPDDCNACAEVFIPWLPANANVNIDGRSGKAWATCRQTDPEKRFITTNRRVDLVGAAGGAFVWPVFPCGTGFCVEIVTSQYVTVGRDKNGRDIRQAIDPQAEIAIWYVPRFDMI